MRTRTIALGGLCVTLLTLQAAAWESHAAGHSVILAQATPPAGGASATQTPTTAPTAPAGSAQGAAPAAPAPAQGGGQAPAAGAGSNQTPGELVASTPKGQLKNPYTDFKSVADQGHQAFLNYGCNGCHGGGGGGGMCPPITNDIWVYGHDDDTLFRLVTLGTAGLQAQGYARKGSENVVGPMPPFGGIIKTSDDLWKIISWIRTINPDSLKPDKNYGSWPG